MPHVNPWVLSLGTGPSFAGAMILDFAGCQIKEMFLAGARHPDQLMQAPKKRAELHSCTVYMKVFLGDLEYDGKDHQTL